MALSSRALLIHILLFPHVVAPTTFYLNCTLPSETFNFVHTPNVRGTLEIVWSCLFTILICSWAVQHLNVPEQVETTDWRQHLKQTTQRLWLKTKWMLITIIAPEIMVGLALQDLMRARRSVREMQAWALEDEIPWTLTHAHYANMGGFMFKVVGDPYTLVSLPYRSRSTISLVTLQRVYEGITKENRPTLPLTYSSHPQSSVDITDSREKPTDELSIWIQDDGHGLDSSRTNSHYSNTSKGTSMRSFQDRPASTRPSTAPSVGDENGAAFGLPIASHGTSDIDDNSQREPIISAQSSTFPYHIYPNADQIRLLREVSIISRLPNIPKASILDKSKSDALVTTLLVIQITHLALSLLSPPPQHLPPTPLEIYTLGLSLISILIYFLNYSKPKNVYTPTDVTGTCASTTNREPLAGHNLNSESMRLDFYSGYCDLLGFFCPWNIGPWTDSFLFPPVNGLIFNEAPRCAVRKEWTYMLYVQLGIAVAGSILGGICCCIAWGAFEFPSFVEIWLWRVASLVMASAGPALLLSVVVFPVYENVPAGMVKRCLWAVPVIFNGVYVVARLCLVGIVVRSLFYLPAGAFVATWADRIPHVA